MRRLLLVAVFAIGCAGCTARTLLPPSAPLAAPLGSATVADLRRNVAAVVLLRYNHEAELRARVDAIGDPSSARYRHFLTPSQFESRYAPTAAQYARVIDTLRHAGFAVVRPYADRSTIDVEAPPAAARRFFGARPGTGSRVPASIAALVRDVDFDGSAAATPTEGTILGGSLDALKKPRPSPAPVPRGPGRPLSGPEFAPNGAWAPRAVADGFDLPVQHGYTGRGVVVAVVAQGAVNRDDVRTFLEHNHLAHKRRIVAIPVAGGPGNADPTEATLDVETIVALAPRARIRIYETPNLSDQSLEDAYAQILSDKKATIVELPFAQCESADPAFVRTSEDDAIAGAALGMTFVAASGDQGSACFNGTTNAIGAQAPASDPHVLAVGGNESVAPSLAPKTGCACPIGNPAAWDDRNVAFGGLSGGGISKIWTLPAYQRNITGSPQLSKTHRNVPDVAFPAVDDDLFIHGADTIVDGTSWSASIATAFLAQTVQMCGALGFVNPAVYRAYANDRRDAGVIDVTHGFNGGYAPALKRGYRATRGYDDVTGIGIPNGFRFAAALCGKSI